MAIIPSIRLILLLSLGLIISACANTSTSGPVEFEGHTTSFGQPIETDKLIGTWKGPWSAGPTRSWEVTMRFEITESKELIGRIVYWGGEAYSDCTGANIKARKKTTDSYEIEIANNALCVHSAELILEDNRLNGKSKSKSGSVKSLNLSRLD